MCKQLIQNGWKLEDIEEADFELLMQVISNKKPQKKPQMLNDFLRERR